MIINKFLPVHLLNLHNRYTTANQNTNVNLKVMTGEDIPEMQAFLKKFFYRDEPLNFCVKLWENENTVKSLEKYCTRPVKDNCSIKATNEKGEIVGVCLNKIRKIIEDDQMEFDDPIFLKIIGLIVKADEGSKIFEKHSDLDKYQQHDIVSIDTIFRGKGLTKDMMNASRDLAHKTGIKLIRMNCSSLFSAKAAETLGFTKIYRIKYEDYKIDGEQVFKPDAPHTEFAVFVKRIDRQIK